MELDCGHDVTPDGCGTGYAVTADGKKICYPCADSAMAAKLTTDNVVGVYIAGNEQSVTTWSGGVLMRIVKHGSHRNGWHASEVHYWGALDADKRYWYGRNGGPGMYVTMKKAKAS